MKEICNSPAFGIVLSAAVYLLCVRIYKRFRSPVLNPLLLSIGMIILILAVLRIPLSSYSPGGDFISMFLGPATAVLAYSIYHQIHILKKHFIPIAAGCLAGSITSMGSAWLLCRLFGLDDTITASMLPKSVTTPIAMEISAQLGGIPSITVAIVIITGILGAMLCPLLIRIFRIKNPVAAGVAIGSCSHAVGTSKAIELGEIEGAMSGIAIGTCGLLTVLIALFL